MVAIVQHYTNTLASGLIPLLSTLSAGSEMASYGNAQWEFLIGSGEVTTFVAVDDVDTTNTELIGCLLRIDMDAAPEIKSVNRIHNDATADNIIGSTAAAAGFGMMLVSPEARGKGVAKLLLHEAMYREDDRKRITDRSKTNEPSEGKEEQIPRKILAVCTKLGQPLYRKLGFSDVGRVTALSATVRRSKEIGDDSSDREGVRVETYGSLNRASTGNGNGNSKDDSSNIDPKIRDLIAAMDARATGWDRRGRLNKLLGHPRGENLRSIAAVATYQDNPIATAVLRQEGPGSPFVIGPMVGSEASALPLISALARAIPDGNENETDSQLSILVSEHHGLVDRLVEAGFRTTFDFPAMTLDDRPIYENGDGSYLSLIHPTLG
jgi:GNAT superfamily N-acetyltransferase